MAISLVVAVTDYDWFEGLRVRSDWAEVNFWAPGAASFRALEPGELFLFKLHSPRKGKSLILPEEATSHPEPAALKWHNSHRFLG